MSDVMLDLRILEAKLSSLLERPLDKATIKEIKKTVTKLAKTEMTYALLTRFSQQGQAENKEVVDTAEQKPTE